MKKVLAIKLIVLGLVSLSIESAVAQTQPQLQKPAITTYGTPTDPDTADVSITSSVTAQELRFKVVPNSQIQFPGSPQRNTGWQTERVNLPKPVQAGVTYRNIGINLEITSVFSDIDRIVSEALGEVQASPQVSPVVPPITQPGENQR
ncbi:hypothetical protein Cri9333_3607 [Crinalium epipsammum PCC 9333]|uniref:Uncharacterized protein n=1 Tax=Crinalium epipsammum PCC 9333 TaxID=1173022 RepID=K9W3Q8_9CYAN|nr:hypothetical protein [Crinalium epipsammum]AFZ14429.1 hypothetical protein Cri9333_3607 [Crinalium epipsammum PCC 9333]